MMAPSLSRPRDKIQRGGGKSVWSSAGKLTITPVSGQLVQFYSSDGGAAGPVLEIFHDSSSPTAGDIVGEFRHTGRDSGGNSATYATHYLSIITTADGSEAGRYTWQVLEAGTAVSALRLGPSAAQSVATMGLEVASKDPGSTGPTLSLYHDSASPAASDNAAVILVNGRDSAANVQAYGKILHQITDPTNTSEDSKWVFQTSIAGTLTTVLTVDGVTNTIAVGGLTISAGGITSTVADAANIAIRSGGSGNFTYYSMGRTSVESQYGVAGASNQFFTGTAAGDIALTASASNLWIGTAAAATGINFMINNSKLIALDATSGMVVTTIFQSNSTTRLCDASGDTLGFFTSSGGTTKQTVTGSRGGNAALASLLTALAAYGLVTDSSSA